MTPLQVERFACDSMLPLLGHGFTRYCKRDIVRMQGLFVQALLFSIKKSGWMHVIPTFYVVGADPVHEILYQSMMIPPDGIDNAAQWKVHFDAELNGCLAEWLVNQLEIDSPLSFLKDLSDNAVHKTWLNGELDTRRCVERVLRRARLVLPFGKPMTILEVSV